MYSKREFGEDLKIILDKTDDIIKIAKWADHIYTIHCRELSSELDDIIMALSAMEHGPEFEYNKEVLKIISEKLINEEIDILQQINEKKK